MVLCIGSRLKKSMHGRILRMILDKLRTVPLVKTASASVCRIEPPGTCQKETRTGKVPRFAWCLVWNEGVKVSNDTLLVLCMCLRGLKLHLFTIIHRSF